MIPLKHEDKKFVFRRVVGGLSAGGDSSYAVTIGEELRTAIQDRQEITTLHYHLLHEAECHNMNSLTTIAILLREKNQAYTFYGRNYQPYMDFLDVFNREAMQRRSTPFYFQEAPNLDDRNDRGKIEFHLNLLLSLIRDGILSKAELERTKVYDYLKVVPPDLTKVSDLKYPQVAALAYACAGLKLTSSPEEDRRETEMAERALQEIYADDF